MHGNCTDEIRTASQVTQSVEGKWRLPILCAMLRVYISKYKAVDNRRVLNAIVGRPAVRKSAKVKFLGIFLAWLTLLAEHYSRDVFCSAFHVEFNRAVTKDQAINRATPF